MTLGPASHEPDRVQTPQNTPFARWSFYGWSLKATCKCGHETSVHMGDILRKFGDQATFNEHNEKRIAKACRCIRCGEREPVLTVVQVD